MRTRTAVMSVVLLGVAAACGNTTTTSEPKASAKPKAVACTGTRLETVRSGVLTVGSDIAYAPFESVDQSSQKPVGFDIDLLTEVAERLQLKPEFVNQTFSGIIAGLVAKRYDVVASAMTITEERRAQLCFSDPYFDANQSLVINVEKTPDIKSTDDLANRTIGVQADTTGEAWANEHLKAKAKTIKSYETAEDAFLDLKSGKIDGIVNDIPVNLYRQTKDGDFKVVQEIPTDEHYGIAVNPENKGLLDGINRSLKAIRSDGTYAKIYETWFGRKPASQ